MSIFHPLEVVGRGSEKRAEVVDIFIYISRVEFACRDNLQLEITSAIPASNK